jgi:monofunctional chorismate mutase
MLDDERTKIDEIDEKIMVLLGERFRLVREIGRLKEEKGLPVPDRGREEYILSSVARRVEDPDAREYVRSLYRTLFALSRDAERRV